MWPNCHAARRLIAVASFVCLIGCTTLRWSGVSDALMFVSESSPPSAPLLEAIRKSLSVEAWKANRLWSAETEWHRPESDNPKPGELRWSFGQQPETTEEKPRPDVKRPSKSDRAKADAATAKNGSKPQDAAAKTDAKTSEVDHTASEVAESSDDSANEGSAAWDGYWPLTVSDLIHRTERGDRVEGRTTEKAAATVEDGMRCLHSLAREDNLAGWNAAILWAQHDPQSAVEIVDVLERLVVSPPVYLTDSGERLASSEGSHPADAKKETSPAPGRNPKSSTSAGDSSHKNAETPPATPSRPSKLIAPSTRAAAAEAWCLVLAASATEPVAGLAPAGRALERTDLSNAVRGELFRGVARWAAPAVIPRLENALRHGEGKKRAPTEIRQAAIDACLIYAIAHRPSEEQGHQPTPPQRPATKSNARAGIDGKSIWPATIMDCRIDPEFPIRRTFISWLGWARPEGAFDLLKKQADSAELGLRAAAMASLGRLHTDEARIELKAQSGKTRDLLRAATVSALASWGVEEITHFGHDPSQIVRIAVAGELAKLPTVDSGVLLSALAIDTNGDVQVAAVRAVKTWPDEFAFPLLLHAMRDSSAKTRLVAAEQLAQRRTLSVEYRFDGPPEQRQIAVNAIAASIGSSLSYLDQVLKRQPRAASQIDVLRATEIREHLAALIENPPESPAAAAAREWLGGISAREVPVVEAFLKEPTKAKPDPIYRDVLPRVSPVYAALIDLASDDVNVRRRGAKVLADRGQAATLPRAILVRLQERIARETDELVWRSALLAIGSDSTDDCAEIANLAVHHQSAEVRVLGCEYLARHGQPAHALWLLDLLEDRNRNVQLAAIRALGNCRNQVAVRGLPPDTAHRSPPNLRALLASADAGIRFAAAVSLCRLGTSEGMQELTRLSYHANSDTREQAVKEMGLSGQTRFVSHLVTLGWTERNAQVRRTILDSLERLVPPENRPRALGETPSPDAKIKLWVQWLQQGDRARAAGNRTPSLAPDAPVTSRPHAG